jgi:hypothetical protein
VQGTITITTNGTCAGSLIVGLPEPSNGAFNQQFLARNNNTGGLLWGVSTGGSTLSLFTTNTAYPGADGTQISFSGYYDNAND